MAYLTEDQWYAKIVKWVPSGFFFDQGGTQEQSELLTTAVMQALAALFSQLDQDLSDQQAATFILQSSAPIIDLLGDERGVPRPAGDTDEQYAPLIQNSLFLNVGKEELQLAINNALNNGPAFLIENEQYGFFDDADVTETPGIPYFDDYYTRWIELAKFYNWFTVIVPIQTSGVDATIQQNIISAIESNKALGATYDVLYESTSDTDTDD